MHAENALRSAGVAQVVYLLFAIAAFEALCAESFLACENSKVFDFVAACAAAVGAVIADEGAVTEEEKVGVGIEEGATSVAAETIDVPSISSCVNRD